MKRLVWIVPIVALGAASVWWLGGREPRSVVVDEGSAKAVAGRDGARKRDPMGYVSRWVGREDPVAVNELIQVYAKWADGPDAIEARKVALRSLLAHSNLRVGLEAALKAAEADQTPRHMDPMWPELVQGVAALWDAVTVKVGRDLVLLETRAKPRDILIESLASIPPGKLTDEQRPLLVSDLIDLYPSLKPEQKPAVDRALTALGGPDLVEILAGRGLGEGSHLQGVVAEQRAQESTKGAPPSQAQSTDDKTAN